MSPPWPGGGRDPVVGPILSSHLPVRVCVLRMCSDMTQKTAVDLLGIASSTLSDLLHRSIKRGREGHKVRCLKTVGIDEISYAKGHKYATIVYDLDRSCVVLDRCRQRPRDHRPVLHRGPQ